MPREEECDGSDLGAKTCASLGFRAGTLGCTTACEFDISRCVPCSTDPHVTACASPLVDARGAVDIAVATKGTETVVAWASCGAGAPGVHVARFGSDLALLSQTKINVPALAVTLAATPTGYILAYEAPEGVRVQRLDAGGWPQGTARGIRGAAFPMLVARLANGVPTGGPLLAWAEGTVDVDPRPPNLGPNQEFVGREGTTLRASVLGVDGAETTPPANVLTNVLDADRGSGVFTGDGFLLAQYECFGSWTWSGIATVHVGLDGAHGPTHSLATNSTAPFPQLAWTGREARVVSCDTGARRSDEQRRWQRIDSTGAPIQDSLSIGVQDRIWHIVSSAVAVGDDTLVLVATTTPDGNQWWDLALLRVDANGRVAGPPTPVARDARIPWVFRLALSGGDAIVAWLGGRYPGRVGLARVRI